MTRASKAWLSGCLPGGVLIAVFVLYGFTHFVFSKIGDNGSVIIVGRIINIVLGLLGLVAMLSVPVGLVLAIVFATQDETPNTPPQTPTQNP